MRDETPDIGLSEQEIKQYLDLSDRIRAEAFCGGYRQALMDVQSWTVVHPAVPACLLVEKLTRNADSYEQAYKVAPQIKKGIAQAKAGQTVDRGGFSQYLPRLLDCGLCYEEDGEEVHPHPQCPIGRPDPLERAALMADSKINPEHASCGPCSMVANIAADIRRLREEDPS